MGFLGKLFNKKKYSQDLLGAATKGKFSGAKELIEKGADANFRDELMGATPLTLSSFAGHTDIVELLLLNNAKVDTEVNSGQTALNLASQNGHLSIVKKLISAGAAINHSDKKGATSLLFAATNGHTDIVNVLLENNAEIDKRTISGVTPLMGAAAEGHLEIVNLLIDKGAEISAKSEEGLTPLLRAAENEHVLVVKKLSKYDLDFNETDKKAQSALMWAAAKGNLEIADILFSKGVETNIANIDNVTALHMAARKGHINIIEKLFQNGANFELKTKPQEITALMLACHQGHIDIVKFMVQKGANINSLNAKGYSAIDYARDNEHMEIVDYLNEKSYGKTEEANDERSEEEASERDGKKITLDQNKDLLNQEKVNNKIFMQTISSWPELLNALRRIHDGLPGKEFRNHYELLKKRFHYQILFTLWWNKLEESEASYFQHIPFCTITTEIVAKADKYIKTENPSEFAKLPADRYMLTSNSTIGRKPVTLADLLICQICPPITPIKKDDIQSQGRHVMSTVQRFASIPIASYFFSLPFLRKGFETELTLRNQRELEIFVYMGVEALLHEFYGALGEGEVITESIFIDLLKSYLV